MGGVDDTTKGVIVEPFSTHIDIEPAIIFSCYLLEDVG